VCLKSYDFVMGDTRTGGWRTAITNLLTVGAWLHDVFLERFNVEVLGEQLIKNIGRRNKLEPGRSFKDSEITCAAIGRLEGFRAGSILW
jgi:hypothetical protein